MTYANAILLFYYPDPKGLVATTCNSIFPFHTESRIPVHGIKTVIFA